MKMMSNLAQQAKRITNGLTGFLKMSKAQRVRVYWNLHKDCYSVLDWEPRSKKKGRLVAHTSSLCLKDAKFIVQPSGNKRVREEKQKNVHAFIEGDWHELPDRGSWSVIGKVKYDPYKNQDFILDYDGQKVTKASEVHCLSRNVEGIARPRVFVPLD